MPREKYRVHEVAKDFGLNSKKILEILDTHMPAERTHMAALEDRELDLIFETVTQENSVASFDAYFAAGESKKAEEAAPKKEEAKAPAKEEKKEAPKADKKGAKPEGKKEFKAKILGDNPRTITLKMDALTDAEKEIILKGCLINYYKG